MASQLCNQSKYFSRRAVPIEAVEETQRQRQRPSSAPSLRLNVPHKAAAKGWPKVIGALSSVMQVDQEDERGWTPAHWASKRGQANVIAKLASLGACLDVQLPGGATPAHIAAANGQAKALSALAEAGACLDTRDSAGSTPAMLAAERGHVPCLNVLSRYVDLDSDVSPLGMTIAHVAVMYGQPAVLDALDALGCKHLRSVNRSGKTPAELTVTALKEGSVAHAAVVQVLKKAGAAPRWQQDHWKPRRRQMISEEEEAPKLIRIHRSLGAAAALEYSPGDIVTKRKVKRTAGYSTKNEQSRRPESAPAGSRRISTSLDSDDEKMRILTIEGYRDLENAYDSTFALAGHGGLDMGLRRRSIQQQAFQKRDSKSKSFSEGPNLKYIWRNDKA